MCATVLCWAAFLTNMLEISGWHGSWQAASHNITSHARVCVPYMCCYKVPRMPSPTPPATAAIQTESIKCMRAYEVLDVHKSAKKRR